MAVVRARPDSAPAMGGLPCRSCIAWQLTAIWLLLLFLLVARLRPHPPSEAGRRDGGGAAFRRERHARGPRALPTAGTSSGAPVPAAQQPEQSQQPPQPQLAGRPWSPQVATAVTAADAARPGAPLGNLSSAALVAELHSRAYGWEVLHAARLDFRDFSELDLVSWLRRDSEKFRAVLASVRCSCRRLDPNLNLNPDPNPNQASLGLSAFRSAELLREASLRPDLGQALAATGLGSGSDFSCAQDESPRDGGCQIRCQVCHRPQRAQTLGQQVPGSPATHTCAPRLGQGRECPRAHRVCKAIAHCVKVDVNKGGTWATLKSLQACNPMC